MSEDTLAAVDRLAIERLVLRFFTSLDQHDFSALAGCFAPEGRWHRQGEQLRGPRMILDAMAKRDPTAHDAHIISNFDAEGDGRNALARFYVMGFHEGTAAGGSTLPPASALATIGLYTCRASRLADGWLIGDLSAQWYRH